MKFRFSLRVALVVTAFVAVLLMNVQERRRHAAAIAEADRVVRETAEALAAIGFEEAIATFGADECRVVVVDIFGKGRASVSDKSLVARRVMIVTQTSQPVFSCDELAPQKPKAICETEPHGSAASCTLSVFANVPSSRPSDANPTLQFDLHMAGGNASGRSIVSTLNMGDDLQDHFRFDLRPGVYPLGEPINFYAIGGNRAGELRQVQLIVGKPAIKGAVTHQTRLTPQPAAAVVFRPSV